MPRYFLTQQQLNEQELNLFNKRREKYMNDVLSSANVSFTRGDLFVLPANFSPTKSFAMLRSVTEEDDGGVSFDCVE
jgi:hypothetical protein